MPGLIRAGHRSNSLAAIIDAAAETRRQVKGNSNGFVSRRRCRAGHSARPAGRHARGAAYTLLDLGSLGEDQSAAAYDVNELGQVVGFTFEGRRVDTAFRTAPNARINPTTDPLGMETALAINDHGVVTGINAQRAAFMDPRAGTVTDMRRLRRAS